MAKNQDLPKIRACLFDMDGLLINSEDLYTVCTNEILHEYGKPDMPWSIKAQLQGRPGPEAGKIFQKWAQLPCSHEEYMEKITARQRHWFPTAKPLPGVPELLKTLSGPANPQLGMALATSSQQHTFQLKTDHLQDLFAAFPKTSTVKGDDPRIPSGRGKPAPDIYVLALKTINEARKSKGLADDISPSECLVFEDSVPGVEAGRRAGMQVIWCPHPELLKEYHGKEKEVLAGLTGEYKEELQPVPELSQEGVSGKPGAIDDGWAILVHSLENFPYQRYSLGSPHEK